MDRKIFSRQITITHDKTTIFSSTIQSTHLYALTSCSKIQVGPHIHTNVNSEKKNFHAVFQSLILGMRNHGTEIANTPS